MSKDKFYHLIAEISATDLTGVSDAELTELYERMYGLLNPEFFNELTDDEANEWQAKMDLVNDELERRGIVKLNLFEMLENNPDAVEAMYSMLPLQDLITMEKELSNIPDSEFKEKLQTLLHNSMTLRLCYLSPYANIEN